MGARLKALFFEASALRAIEAYRGILNRYFLGQKEPKGPLKYIAGGGLF